MDFSYTDEEQMLLDSTRRYIASSYGFEQRRQSRDSTDGWSREVWQQLAELGLLALNVPEQYGGIGAGGFANMLVCGAVGEGLLLEPYLSSAVVGTRAVELLGTDDQRARLLPALAEGRLIAVLAHDEPDERNGVDELRTRALRDGDNWRLSGAKRAIHHADAADLLLVSACIEDEEGAVAVFEVPVASQGVGIDGYRTVDDQRAADLDLSALRLPAEARLGSDRGALLQSVLDFRHTSLCAEAVGVMQKLLDATIEHARSRRQFGQPIGSFQALRHRMADMLMQVEQARAITELATARCEAGDALERRRAVSAAVALVSAAARFVGQNAIQLHGGMGMTDELEASHLFKRLLAFELRSGSPSQHLRALREASHMQAGGAIPPN